MSLDALVLQHLYARGYMQAADKLKEELGVDEPADNTTASTSRPTLHRLLTTETAPMYAQSYRELREWVDGSLDAFKPELQQVLYPLFVHCYLALVQSSDASTRGHAARFAEEFRDDHALRHRDELNLLQQVTTREQLGTHSCAMRDVEPRPRPYLDAPLTPAPSPASIPSTSARARARARARPLDPTPHAARRRACAGSPLLLPPRNTASPEACPLLLLRRYAKRMLGMRYEVALSAYARALLLRFLQQALTLTLTLTLTKSPAARAAARVAAGRTPSCAARRARARARRPG